MYIAIMMAPILLSDSIESFVAILTFLVQRIETDCIYRESTIRADSTIFTSLVQCETSGLLAGNNAERFQQELLQLVSSINKRSSALSSSTDVNLLTGNLVAPILLLLQCELSFQRLSFDQDYCVLLSTLQDFEGIYTIVLTDIDRQINLFKEELKNFDRIHAKSNDVNTSNCNSNENSHSSLHEQLRTVLKIEKDLCSLVCHTIVYDN